MKLLFSICLAFLSPSSFALDEATLATEYKALAVPYFQASRAQIMTAKDGVQIHYRYFPANGPLKGTVLIVSGRTEFMSKYSELLYDLKDSGYEFFIYDHRGQGESQRLLADPLKGYVGEYQDYVDDLDQLMRQVVIPHAPGKIYFLAHSLGGGIATAYLLQHPERVSALVASSPMYAPNLLGVPQELGLDLMEGAVDCGMGDWYGPKQSASWNSPFSANQVNTSANRYADAQGELLEHPELVVAGATNRWLREAIRIGIYVRANAAKLVTPTLIFQAGQEHDVLPEAENQVADDAKDARIISFSDSMHEILMETDAIRNVALDSAVRFFESH